MTPLVLWIVRILVVLMVVRYVIRALNGRRRVARAAPQRLGGRLVRDPHCGTYLPPARAVTTSRRGELMHFCSERCRDAWLSDERSGRRVVHAP